MLSAATAALVLTVPFATNSEAETVERVAAKKVADRAVSKPALKTAAKPAKATLPAPRLAGSKLTAHQLTAAKPSPIKVAAVSVSKPKPRPVATSLRASINLSSQTMTVKVHGKTKYVWKISSGRKGYITPNGTWRPKWMSRMHYSKKYDNAPMPHSVFFHGGYAIHATYATGRLGRPASHGCIRLSPSNAKRFYGLVSKYGKSATRISITGRTPTYRVAKRKTRRKTYKAKYSGGNWAASKPKRKKHYKARRKPAPKPSYNYSYYAPKKKYTWPGDR
ncbi:MAG: L,D-transpeptidase family protein [Alphaproteobacteria bacterium]|nr:L,D-transpeptidase family protein [Alphaproteobacteria bacterium]